MVDWDVNSTNENNHTPKPLPYHKTGCLPVLLALILALALMGCGLVLTNSEERR